MEEQTRSGLRKVITGIFINLLMPIVVAVIGVFISQKSDLTWIPLSITVTGAVVSGFFEMIGYMIAGKCCPHFKYAFMWEIAVIAVTAVYFAGEIGYELTKQSWMIWPTSLLNWVTIVLDLIVLWSVTRGCVEATDDEDAIVRLANISFLLATLAEGIMIACNIVNNINTDFASWVTLISAVMLLVSGILQVVLLIRSYHNVYIPEEIE